MGRAFDALIAGLCVAVITTLTLCFVLLTVSILFALHPVAGIAGGIGIAFGVGYGISVYTDP